MDHKLKNALEFANYAHALHNQKKLLKQKFFDSCVFYHNAGKFTITKELINYCVLYKEDEEIILLDDNDVPIQIKNMSNFTNSIINQYETAKYTYHKEYMQLISNKSVKGLVDE